MRIFILNESKEKEKFLKEWKIKIAEKLKIKEDKLIFTDVNSGSLAVHAAIIDPSLEEEKAMMGLGNEIKIKKIEEKPMLEALKISPEILDKRRDMYEGWGINVIRGEKNTFLQLILLHLKLFLYQKILFSYFYLFQKNKWMVWNWIKSKR